MKLELTDRELTLLIVNLERTASLWTDMTKNEALVEAMKTSGDYDHLKGINEEHLVLAKKLRAARGM